MKKILYLLATLALFLLSCKETSSVVQKNSLTSVLPLVIYEEDEIIINAIKDSTKFNYDEETIYFRVYIIMQDLSQKKGYIKLEQGKGKLFIPKGAAFLSGNFYTSQDMEEKSFERMIYDKKSNKEVINAYQIHTNMEMMNKELANYPNNLAIYAKYVQELQDEVYFGRVSDSVVQIEAQKYLGIIENKVNVEKASDLYALVVLNNHARRYKEAENLLLEMTKKHSHSYFLKEAYSSYRVWSKMYREYPDRTINFVDSLDKYIANKIPYSPVGVDNSIFRQKNYSKKDIAINAQYYINNIDSTFIILRRKLVNIHLNSKNIEKAKKLSIEKLKNAKSGRWRILNPTPAKDKMMGANEGSMIGFAYQSLAEVSQAEKDYHQAIKYLDSAYLAYQTDRQNRFINNPITKALNLKASIQKEINQPNQALQTYETLYQETKDDRVLDSIKILFKEKEQEKGFESYAKNLKERVENENTEPKKLATDFSIKDMSGYEIKLSEWKGRVVVLNFWANYCLPCAREIPYLNKIWRETQTDEIIFLSVTKNTPLEVTRFAQRQKEMFSFSILPNAKELADVYDVNLVPTTIVINKKGEIVHRESGFSGNIDKLKQVVLEELSK
ncbi:redoxin domain-containing protein [Bernardetia sp. ABR2-2B]|uniref:TlpA disulfide reductase family protein n=1 Tax=Bernardetia sp. ABR2-2B TaxID=3127472 RepID=UPI0030CD7360